MQSELQTDILVLTKTTKMSAILVTFFTSKYTKKILLRPWLCPGPYCMGKLITLPRPPSWAWRSLLGGEGREDKKEIEGRKRETMEGEMRGLALKRVGRVYPP